jgi:hypothetical protein
VDEKQNIDRDRFASVERCYQIMILATDCRGHAFVKHVLESLDVVNSPPLFLFLSFFMLYRLSLLILALRCHVARD